MSIRVVALTALLAAACSKSTAASKTGDSGAAAPDKVSLEALNARVEKLEQKLRRIEQAAGLLEPDPKVTYSMPVEGYPTEGPASAKITLVEGFEFACPYCYQVRPTIAELKKKYKDDIRVVYKQLIVHQQVALAPALAVCAAQKQGKYAAMENLVWEEGFAKANAGDEFDPAPLAPENLEKLAGKAGLDLARYQADATGEACLGWVRDSHVSFNDLSVGATPAFFINGRFLAGAQPLENFVEVIDEELAKANKAIAGGAKAESYYQDHVVARGKTEVE